jgi:DNA polymerase-1
MRLVFDIETNGLIPELDTIHSIVLTDVDTKETYSFCDQQGYPSILCGLAFLKKADVLIGHNIIGFDIPAIQKVMPNWKTNATLRDTLIISRLIWTNVKDIDFGLVKKGTLPPHMMGRHSLEAWGYRVGVYKGDYGKTTDWSVWTKEMQDYCEQDVAVQCALWNLIESKNYSEQAIELEQDFHALILKQEAWGFAFDVAAAGRLCGTLAHRRMELEKELQCIFPPRVETMKTPDYWEAAYGSSHARASYRGSTKTECRDAMRKMGFKPSEYVIEPGPLRTKEHPFNPGSRDQIAAHLNKKYGWKPKLFTKGGKPQVDETVLEELPYPEVKPLCEYLLVCKRLGQLAEGAEAWLKAEKKGRIHGRVNTNGAVTGRCTHSKPNVAQVPKVGSPYGTECRSLFTATPGYLLVGADASGLELRCLAHYMAKWDDGAYAKILLEGDIHSVNQQAAGLPTRDNAKTFIYAFLYGAGDEKIGSIIGKGKAAGKKLRTKFLEGLPALDKLSRSVKTAAGFYEENRNGQSFWKKNPKASRHYLIGLDGRQLHVRSGHSALNTLLQSAGALIMKQAAVFLYQQLTELGYEFGVDYGKAANVHDEFQIDARPEIAEVVGQQAVRAIQRSGQHFNFRCPLDGEYKIGRNWAETH